MDEKKLFTLNAPCLFGLESVLKYEAGKLGFADVEAGNGYVNFSGGYEEIARANISLRTAERVRIQLAAFKAETFEELFDNVYAINLEDFIQADEAFPVTGYSLNSKLASVPACQSIIKKAAVKRLESKYHIQRFPETGQTVRIQFSLMKDQAAIFLDSSGVGLHKRGYRKNSVIAPIKETLAAGIADFAHIGRDSFVVDPLCGSGTLLIEAGLRALSVAPGLGRRFAFEFWKKFPQAAAKTERERARDLIRRDAKFEAFGSDTDPEAVELTRENAGKAGLGSRIKIKRGELSAFKPPRAGAALLTNPPYGERMLDIKQAEEIYALLGGIYKKEDGLSSYIISPHENFERIFGKAANKRRKLYNGMIKCQLYMYF
ncbi:MAG: class I SAM-dependent RNA methyltransferase [Oscillospiraceae bacterium]|jgi:putative N6-adenine-specific DNA methylase|nr:class I SAM-dependent RNA methyltransferase [Oscillospiraceae bacterium]